jgi:hypothetical protein
VKNRRPITEDDVLLTELLIARSYGNLKKSVVRTSFNAIGSVGGTLKKHPCATAGAAVGAGILLSGLIALMFRGGSGRRRDDGDRDRASRPDMGREIFSLLMPVITPYITAYLEKFMGRTFSRDRR